MEFSIGSEFSREFTFEESRITYNLSDELNLVFKEKNYGDRIFKVYIGVICVSKEFEAFCVARPLKILKNEPALEYEFTLDFDLFKSSNEEKRKQILVTELLKITRDFLSEKTIKGFDKEQFIEDLSLYFTEQGYLVE